MPRRHEDHQPVNLAAFYRFQLGRDLFVMLRALVKRVGVFSEPEETVARFPRLLHLQQRFQFRQ